ncbi:TPA: VC2046/SO_2500 family protein [Photobacterium damselae]
MTAVHTLDKAQLINEIQLGNQLGHAVEQGRRSDFALMLALLSPDFLENTPVDHIDNKPVTDSQLRGYFELQDSRPLTTSEFCYERGAVQAEAFHQGGLASCRLMDGLQPIALTFPPQDTKGMPEELYHNLSGHERRKLPPTEIIIPESSPQRLYGALVQAKRFAEMQIQAPQVYATA